MSAIYKTFIAEIKAVDPEQGIYEAMVSTEGVDRDGDILEAMGAEIDNYLKNPVVLFGHQYFTPDAVVARALEVTKIPGRGVKKVIQFVKRGISRSADLVHDLFANGYLQAFSVGFIPIEQEPRKDANGDELTRGVLYKKWELLESSVVIVPSNQDALAIRAFAKSKGYEPEAVNTLFEQKRGRVLNAKNEQNIRDAIALLNSVLESLGEEPEQDSAEPPEVKTVIPYRDQGTADEGESWSAPNLASFTDETFADISDAEKRRIAAHYTWSANMPPENFGDLKLPHHRAAKSGVGPAVWRGVAAGMAALMGGRGGVDVPESDKRGIYNHLASHYKQWDKEPPEFRAYSEEELLKLFPEVVDGADESDAEPIINDGQVIDSASTHDASEAELEAVTESLSVLLATYKEVIK